MISLITFGICLGIAVLLMVVLWLLMGDGFFVPFILLPMTLAAMVTGAGTGRPKPLANVLFFAFILLLVLLLAGGVYLAYPFLSRAMEALLAVFKAWQALPRAAQTGHLQLVNHLLFLSTASLVTERVVNAVGCRAQLRTTNKGVLFARYGQPLFMHGLAFVVLFSTRSHLMTQPLAPYAPGYFLIGVLLVYGKYLLTSLLRNLNNGLAMLYYRKAMWGQVDGLATVLASLHAAGFGYFLVRVFLAV
jgi:hypothetical protein